MDLNEHCANLTGKTYIRVCKRWYGLLHDGPRWKGVVSIAVHGPAAGVSTFKTVRTRCSPELRCFRMRSISIDRAIWNALIDLVNECKQLSFLHIDHCRIDDYNANGWSNLRPIYSILISNCADAESRYCGGWKDIEPVKNLYHPLSKRACFLTVLYRYNKTFARRVIFAKKSMPTLKFNRKSDGF